VTFTGRGSSISWAHLKRSQERAPFFLGWPGRQLGVDPPETAVTPRRVSRGHGGCCLILSVMTLDHEAPQDGTRSGGRRTRVRLPLHANATSESDKHPGPRHGRERPPTSRPAKREQSTVCNRTTSPTGDLLRCKPPEQTYRRRPQVKEERGEALPTAAACRVCRGPGRDAAEDRSRGPRPAGVGRARGPASCGCAACRAACPLGRSRLRTPG